MNNLFGPERHPSAGDLVRYLDAELSELEERSLREHLAECATCAAELEAMAGSSGAVSRYLARTSPPAPDQVTRARALASVRRASASRLSQRHRVVRAITAASVVLVLAFAAQPVWAWLSSRWRGNDVREEVPRPAVRVAARPADDGPAGAVVAFSPRGALFEVQIEHPQERGELLLEVREVERASAQTVGGSVETMVVLPSGLRVENGVGSQASYRVIVPADLPLLRITVAGTTVANVSVDPDSVPWSRSFPLSDHPR